MDVPCFLGRMPLRLHFLDEGILPPSGWEFMVECAEQI